MRLERAGDTLSAQPWPARYLRARAAARYLGMCKSEFMRSVRPSLAACRRGAQGIVFDRLELDAWAGAKYRRDGRPASFDERAIAAPGAPSNCRDCRRIRKRIARKFTRATSPTICAHSLGFRHEDDRIPRLFDSSLWPARASRTEKRGDV
jgi:hypothetical protein